MTTFFALLPILGALIPFFIHEYTRAETKHDANAPERQEAANEKLVAVGSDRDVSLAVADKLRALQNAPGRP